MIASSNRFKPTSEAPVWFVVIALLLTWLGTGRANDDQAKQVSNKLHRVAPSRGHLQVAPVHANLDSGLNQILLDPSPVERARGLGYRTRDDQVQVVLVTQDHATAEVMAWLDGGGATGVMSAGNLVEAFVAPDVLVTIVADERVLYVRKPRYLISDPRPDRLPHPKVGAYTSEGVIAMNADAWHSAGYTGQGTKVAVIDIGFEGSPTIVGTDLPAGRTFAEDFTGSGIEGENSHGTACAEIVYDIVPGIDELHLFRVQSLVQTVNAIEAARVRGIDVISISLGTFGWGPGDGTGLVANALDSFAAAGGVASISAGNYRVAHWQGRWVDSSGDGWLDFSSERDVNYLTTDGETLFEMPADTDISVQLVWNQWSAPATDLNLYLYRWDLDTEEWVREDSSTEEQTGRLGQWPVEFIAFTTIEVGYYGVTVSRDSGPTSVDIELVIRPESYPLMVNIPDGSISQPGDTTSAISVAALDGRSPYPLEYYSSRGPTNGPGGRLSGGFIKPDISGYANVSTASYGPRGPGSFNGTSAACPHVAGAAALVWSANSGWTNSQVRTFLESRAIDKGPAGKDIDYGWGRLHLGSPDVAPPPGGACNQDLNNGVVCLRDGRFEFIGTWTDFAASPNTRPLIWTPVENINATAGFQNNPSGIQIVMRIADGCSLTGSWWVWLGGFTDAGWDIRVRDTVTGNQTTFTKPRQGGVFPTTLRDSTTFTCN